MTIKINNEIEMVGRCLTCLAVLDKLVSNVKTTAVVGQPTNTQLIKQLTDELESSFGNPILWLSKDLNKGNTRRTLIQNPIS